MLQRVLTIALLVGLLLLALQNWNTGTDAYFAMQAQKVEGRPYLVLQYVSSSLHAGKPYFGIFTPKDKNLEEWESLTSEPRNGPVTGLFSIKPAAAEAPANPGEEKPVPERLGLFHEGRITVIDVDAKPLTDTFARLPFRWTAETAVYFKGDLYAFGAELPENYLELLKGGETVSGPLRAAKFDGKEWNDLKLEGPQVKYVYPGFWLQAVALKDDIRILWRQYVSHQVLDENIEGMRLTGSGPLYVAAFDGRAFANAVPVSALPQGNLSAWPELDCINLLIQPTAPRAGGPKLSNPMEVRALLPDAAAKGLEAKLLETIGADKPSPRPGLLDFIAAERIEWDGQEFIIRSNWQSFEVWKKTSEEGWKLAVRNPKGLPTHDVDTMLLSSLLMCLAMVAFGVGLAYRRRRVRWDPRQKIEAKDVYASLIVRVGAYFVDMTIVMAVLILAVQHLGWSFVASKDMFDFDLTRLSHAPFFLLYALYFVLTEWLLGATLGKYIMGLRVVMVTGAKVTFWGAVVRNLVGFFERLPLTGFIALLMIIFTPNRQRLGDLLSRTCVVHGAAMDAYNAQKAEREAAQANDAFGFPVENAKKADE